jgi:hypothetical protein
MSLIADNLAGQTQARSSKDMFAPVKVMIAGALFMARLGYNAAFPFPVCLATTPLALGWLMAQKLAAISWPRVALFLAIVIAGLLSFLFAAGKPGANLSMQSMLLYFGIFAMFLAPIRLGHEDYLRYFRLIANTASLLCLIGAAQYAVQFVIKANFLFSWREVIPSQFLIEYNTLNETQWGSGVYKANGFFLLEASHLSQFAARALLIALVVLRDPRYVIPIGMGMLTAYSGTGFVLLGLFGLVPLAGLLFSDKRLAPLGVIVALALPATVAILWVPLNLELFVDRLGEFGDTRSSAFARFGSGGALFQSMASTSTWSPFFGAGPGMTEHYLHTFYGGEAFPSTWIKLLIDYGFIGFFAFCAFFFYCVYSTLRSPWLAAAFLFQFLVLDGGLLVPQQVFAALILGCLVVRAGGPAEQRPLIVAQPLYRTTRSRPPAETGAGRSMR